MLLHRFLSLRCVHSHASVCRHKGSVYYVFRSCVRSGRVVRVPSAEGNRLADVADDKRSGLVPTTKPIPQSQLNQLAQAILSSTRTTVLTGAGVSTASGIPDYRGPGGAYTRVGYQPMTHQTFIGSAKARSRYWARNYAGWEQFRDVQPNSCHLSLAELQKRGWIDFLITQNVDRLHHAANSDDIIELHGTTHEVICTACGDLIDREEFQQVLSRLNPNAVQLKEVHPEEHAPKTETVDGGQTPNVRPDGDVELRGAEEGFVVPSCLKCDGVLKPHVVFFGDSVPRNRAEMAFDVCAESEMLLVVGSSVAVYSAYRLVKAAKDNNATVVIVNIGETRADALCDLKIEGVVGDVLSQLAAHPLLQKSQFLLNSAHLSQFSSLVDLLMADLQRLTQHEADVFVKVTLKMME